MGKKNDIALEAYCDGANLALYHIAKAFCVDSRDIREADMGVGEKAKLLAQRIKEEVGGNDGTTDS